MADIVADTALPALADSPGAQELGVLLQIEDIDTVGKNIAWLVQEMLLKGFDAISHADLAARVELILTAMPSARPLILGMQFAIMEEDFALAFDHAALLVERESELMAKALAARGAGV
jgi:hypothetical protein